MTSHSQQILQMKKNLISKSYNYMVIILLPRNSDEEMKYFTVHFVWREQEGDNKYFTKNIWDTAGTMTKWKFPWLQWV